MDPEMILLSKQNQSELIREAASDVKPLQVHAYKRYSSFSSLRCTLASQLGLFAKWAPSWALPEQGII
jgi:hypothetical protein